MCVCECVCARECVRALGSGGGARWSLPARCAPSVSPVAVCDGGRVAAGGTRSPPRCLCVPACVWLQEEGKEARRGRGRGVRGVRRLRSAEEVRRMRGCGHLLMIGCKSHREQEARTGHCSSFPTTNPLPLLSSPPLRRSERPHLAAPPLSAGRGWGDKAAWRLICKEQPLAAHSSLLIPHSLPSVRACRERKGSRGGEGRGGGERVCSGWLPREDLGGREARTPPPTPGSGEALVAPPKDAFCERPLRLAPRATICWEPPGRRSGASSADQERSERGVSFPPPSAPSSEKLSTIPEFQARKKEGEASKEKEISPAGALCQRRILRLPRCLAPGERAKRYLKRERRFCFACWFCRCR